MSGRISRPLNLLDLPNEIISHILSFFHENPYFLFWMRLVCRRINKIAHKDLLKITKHLKMKLKVCTICSSEIRGPSYKMLTTTKRRRDVRMAYCSPRCIQSGYKKNYNF